MRHTMTTFSAGLTLAFLAGAILSPLAREAISEARAESAALMPAVIDLTALKHADLPKTSNADMNGKMLVATDNATIGIQSGNVAKHIHSKTDEIQYIIEGSGAMWIGGERREFKPGTLLVIPRGTAHGGTIVSSGPVKALAIKIPPQPKDDTTFVD